MEHLDDITTQGMPGYRLHQLEQLLEKLEERRKHIAPTLQWAYEFRIKAFKELIKKHKASGVGTINFFTIMSDTHKVYSFFSPDEASKLWIIIRDYVQTGGENLRSNLDKSSKSLDLRFPIISDEDEDTLPAD